MHEDPPDNVVKVIADVDEDDPWGRSTEGLWAEPLGGDRYRLWNVPWHARDLNWGDVVRRELRNTEARGEHLHVGAALERSGHVGFAVYFFKERPDSERDTVLRALEEMGTWFEWYEPGGEGSGRLHAVDVPPEADWEQVYAYLTAQEDEGVLGWQSR